jgi:hypothetical protein
MTQMEAYEQSIINDATDAQSQAAFEELYQSWTEEYDIQINNDIWDNVYVKGETIVEATTETDAE